MSCAHRAAVAPLVSAQANNVPFLIGASLALFYCASVSSSEIEGPDDRINNALWSAKTPSAESDDIFAEDSGST